MEPFIKNGEYVIIEWTHVARNNEIVIAVVDGEVDVKRLAVYISVFTFVCFMPFATGSVGMPARL